MRAEFCEVNRIIYHNLQATNKLVVVADDDVRADAFPEGLKGRSSFPLPRFAGGSDGFEDVEVKQIAHVLCDQEMYQLPSQVQKSQVVFMNNGVRNSNDVAL